MKKKPIKKKKKEQTSISIDLSVHLKTLAGVNEYVAGCIISGTCNGKNITYPDMSPGEYSVEFTYPLSFDNRPFKFPIVIKDFTSIGEICSFIAKTYRKIYKAPVKYGIWGHEFNDLHLEGIDVNLKTNKITLSIGS